MPRFKSVEDIVKAYENAGFTVHRRDTSTYWDHGDHWDFHLEKTINVVKGKPYATEKMFVSIADLRNGVETLINFPHIKRKISRKTTGVTKKEIEFKYKKTPEGLVLHEYDFKDEGARVIDGKITVTSEILKKPE